MLDGISLFAGLAPQDRAALAERCKWRRYSAQQQIVGHLDSGDDVFFVVAGRVRVTLYALSGREVTFRDLCAGEMFGEFAAIDGAPRSATVIALAESLIASMPGPVFREIVRDHPAVAWALLERLTRQLRHLTERVFEFSVLAVRNRIHAELLRLARDNPQDDNAARIAPAPTHAEIASRISTHREAVTRELNDLARAGLIERREGVLIVRDVRSLDRMVREVLGE